MFKQPISFFVLGGLLGFYASNSVALDLISRRAGGPLSDGTSWASSISDDGSRIAFESGATNLVSGDGNAKTDIFVYDRANDSIRRVSVTSGGQESDGNSINPLISGNGRYVVFESSATNLATVPNGNKRIYRHDLETGITILVSLTNLEAVPNQECKEPAINQSGNYIAFVSNGEFVDGVSTSFTEDVFLRDIDGGTTVLVSVDVNGMHGTQESKRPSISADGNLISFDTQSDLLNGGDTNMFQDVYLRNVTAGVTELVSVNSNEEPGDGSSNQSSISGDGSLIAFTSRSSNFAPNSILAGSYTKVHVRDRNAGETFRVSTGQLVDDPNGGSDFPVISSNGTYVAFQSAASDLITPGLDTNAENDVYLYNISSGGMTLISRTANGAQSTAGSYSGRVANTGVVSFNTRGTGLVSSDTNNFEDVYATFTRPGAGTDPSIIAQERAFQRKIAKLKKQLITAQKAKKTAKVKTLARLIRKFSERLSAL